MDKGKGAIVSHIQQFTELFKACSLYFAEGVQTQGKISSFIHRSATAKVSAFITKHPSNLWTTHIYP